MVSRKSCAFLGVLVLSVLLTAWWWWRTPKVTDALPNDFCEVKVIKNADGLPLSTRIRIARDQGFYLTIIMEQKPNCPTELDGLFVEEYGMWANLGTLTPCSLWPSDNPIEERVRFAVRHYTDDFYRIRDQGVSPEAAARHRRIEVVGGNILNRPEAGYDFHPERPTDIPAETRCAFGFVALPRDAKDGDEFVMEIFLLPHAHQVSNLRSIVGPEVLLWRGILACDNSAAAPVTVSR